jgi:biopolymer transport protein ExbD
MAARSLPSGDEGGGDDGIVAEINITPLTDIFLVLLIIFMVTTSVISNQGKEVDLPSSAVASQTPSGVNVTVTSAGEIQVDDQTVSEQELPGVLKAAL